MPSTLNQVLSVRFVVLLDGVLSSSPGSAGFTRIRNRLQAAGATPFVYFSYSTAGDGAAGGDRSSLFYRTGWGDSACDGAGGVAESGNLTSL